MDTRPERGPHCAYISMALCKTVVTPLLTHWSYCSLALSDRYFLAHYNARSSVGTVQTKSDNCFLHNTSGYRWCRVTFQSRCHSLLSDDISRNLAALWILTHCGRVMHIQWNLSITTTWWDTSLPSGAHLGGQGPPRWAPEGRNC